MSRPNTEVEQYRKLAVELVKDAVECLRRPPPRQEPRPGEKRAYWLRNWSEWEADRIRDLQFFRDRTRCGPWCALAGVDPEQIVARLEAEGVMYDAKDVYPVSLGGYSKQKDPDTIVCGVCNLTLASEHGLKVHRTSCVGRDALDEMIYEYTTGASMAEILTRFDISHTTFYKLMGANGVERQGR